MISAVKLAVEIHTDTRAAERELRGIGSTIDHLAGKRTMLSHVFEYILPAT